MTRLSHSEAEDLKTTLYEARDVIDDLLETFFKVAIKLDRYSEFSDQVAPALLGLMSGNDVNPTVAAFNIDNLLFAVEAASEEAAA